MLRPRSITCAASGRSCRLRWSAIRSAVGLAPNNGEISRALLVAAQAGYWRLFHSPEKYRVYAMLRLIGAPIARVLGYVPGRLGIGEDLPRDVFLEWTG